MKAQSSKKKSLNKIGTLILLATLLFGCATNPDTPKVSDPKPTKTKSAPSPTKIVKNNPPRKVFSIQNANRIAPEGVIEEVDFGGQGGGGDATCDYDPENKYPVIQYYTNERDWLEPIYIGTCGWEAGEQVRIEVETPNNEVFTDTVEAQYEPETSFYYVDYMYQDNIDSQKFGQYVFKFEGINGEVKVSVNVQTPNESRMYFIENIQAYYLYGFSANEQIRFFWYEGERPSYQFKGWDSYYVDENGELLIEVVSNDGFYTALGSKSGVVGNRYNVLNNNSSQTSCPNALPSRLKVGKYAYVAKDPPLDNRVREGASTNFKIIGYIETGNSMKILDGPKCANGWAWWKVQSTKNPDLVGWTSEGDDVYWLIPCNSLSSCP